MTKHLRIILIFSFSLVISIFRTPSVSAFYDPRDKPNNVVGVHILDHSELDKAAQLVNSNGGDWGYVTIPIQPTDRDKKKWTAFMQQAAEKHLTPILRITTIPQGGTWSKASDYDLVDFANFLNELPWPTTNRYVIVFNETNRAAEWGGAVEPEKYGSILKNASTIFKERSPDFFILPAGLDLALPNSSSSLTARDYLLRIVRAHPDITNYIDGWTSHSYPNPAFSASPFKTGWLSILGYREELKLLRAPSLPVFITETGWDSEKISSSLLSSYFATAFGKWLADTNVIAVTPFVLDAREGDFAKFSLLDKEGNPKMSYNSVQELAKKKGEPELAQNSPLPQKLIKENPNSSASNPSFHASLFLLQIENMLRKIFQLPEKLIVTVGSQEITAEHAHTPDQLTKGLSGRLHLDSNTGMLFTLPQTHVPRFWMKDMNFPLDIIWVREGRIVDISKNVPPPSGGNLPLYSPGEPTDAVLEVNAGWTETHNINIGDKLEVIAR